MVLWTVIPLEDVFPDEKNAAYDEIEYSGLKMTVEKIAENQCRIVRLLSTNPEDFLRQDLQPGVVLNYSPT